MAGLQCDRQIPEVQGLKDQELTVGRPVILTCRGEIDPGYDFKEAQVLLDPKSQNSVRIVKADLKSPSIIEVGITFYSAGEFKFPDLILIDGKSELNLGPQNFKVETVLEKKEDGKPQSPFGAILPASLSWPALYTWILLAVFLLAVGSLFAIISRRFKYKALVAKLKNHDSIVSPDLQFYKSIRAAEGNAYPIVEVEKAFRLYLLRRFQVPAFDLKDGSLVSYFKSLHPWLKKERKEITKILSDVQLIASNGIMAQSPAVESDKKILIQKMYRFVDHAESLLQRTTR